MRNSMAANLAATILAIAIFALAAGAQPQAQSQNPPPQDPQAQPAADSVADAARKAKTDKPKTAQKKVFTEEDIPSLKKGGLSVVGEKDSGTDADAAKADAKTAEAKPADAAKTEKDEAYWRGRAQKIRDQMAAVDQEIDKVQDEIKKGGAAGFDAQTGRNQNVVFFEDRNSQLKNLQKKKDELQKQMDALEDEARQAGVPVGWLR
jgi:hypothetical protein